MIRRSVRDFLGHHDVPDEVVDDVELAVSELATNVIRHTPSTSISLVAVCHDGDVIIDVAAADGVPSLDHVELPPADQLTGRGLYVVDQVMDDVRTADVDGARVVRCRRRLVG